MGPFGKYRFKQRLGNIMFLVRERRVYKGIVACRAMGAKVKVTPSSRLWGFPVLSLTNMKWRFVNMHKVCSRPNGERKVNLAKKLIT